ncbi:hypothetical protein EDC96DRAFT_528846, partial [Choanephora cucurbitarum]
MSYIGYQELVDFVSNPNTTDCSLKAFIATHEDIIVSTNHFNSPELMKSLWTKRYLSALKNLNNTQLRRPKELAKVESCVWKLLYMKRPQQTDPLSEKLFHWCIQLFKNDDISSDVHEITQEVVALEKKSERTLADSLKIMATKSLLTFDNLNHLEKCVLKLAVSKIVNLSSPAFAAEFQKAIDISKFQELSKLKPPSFLTEKEEDEIKTIFERCRQSVFVDNKPVNFDIEVSKEGQIGYIMMFMKSKFSQWKYFAAAAEEEEDSEDCRKKRKREELDEEIVVETIKEILNTLFADTLMHWKSGENTTVASKRMKIANELSFSNNGLCKNVMGRRSDLILYNSKKTALCLSEAKNGRSISDDISQQSKSIRCSKSLQAYNRLIGGSDSIWSFDWSGTRGHLYSLMKYEGVDVVLPGRTLCLPTTASQIEDLQATLVAFYELKVSKQ